MQPWMIAAAVVGGYLLGSIPFGVIATRMAGMGDIRNVGSGNIGATNVLRTGRKDLALITLLGDAAKGASAVLLAKFILADLPLVYAVAGGAAFVGHLFPVWLKFKGGKGVATFLGVMLAVWWPAGLAACGMWLLMFAASRISSLSALAAAALSPAFVFFTQGPYEALALAMALALLIFIRHHENIARLLKGEEPRFGAKP
jgi:acyl phosphate:glycerol-3-phosphate acyltransferase